MAFIFELPADKAPPRKKRDYLIPADLKTKKIKTEEVTREWVLQSYLSKAKFQIFNFQIHQLKLIFCSSNQLKVTQAVQLTISEKGQEPTLC